MAERMNNTLQEVLQRFLKDIAQAKATLPETELDFLYELESMLLGKLREPVQQMMDQGQLPQTPPPNAQGMPPQMQGMMTGPTGGTSSGGVAPMSPAPNADELRRLLSQ